MKTKNYTEDEKVELVNRVDAFRNEGMNVKRAAKKAGVSDFCYYTWKRDGTGGGEPPTDKRIKVHSESDIALMDAIIDKYRVGNKIKLSRAFKDNPQWIGALKTSGPSFWKVRGYFYKKLEAEKAAKKESKSLAMIPASAPEPSTNGHHTPAQEVAATPKRRFNYCPNCGDCLSEVAQGAILVNALEGMGISVENLIHSLKSGRKLKF